jgi:polysaccharide pyruvyl transferase WcaK-like protein
MRVILINSTEFNNHHGCELVSAQIKKFLQLYKIELINECYNFETYFQIIEKVKNSKFDIALVNGEGTMHDCQEQSISLLNVSEYINLHLKKKIILFNASVENMDKEIHKFKNFYKIYVRDFDSYNYLKSKKYKSKFNSDMLITYQIEKNLKKKNSKKF